MTDQAQENRRYVRRLLKEKQPGFAAVLESVEQELRCHTWWGKPGEHRPTEANPHAERSMQ